MNVVKITYTGKTISTNTVRGKHFRTYLNKLNTIKLDFKVLIKNSGLPKCNKVWLKLHYNNRLDVDGNSFMWKAFMDEIVKLEKLPDDTKEYSRLMYIKPDESLPKGTLLFKIYYK